MVKFCPFCGGETVPNMRFCPECGKDLSAVIAEQSESDKAPTKQPEERIVQRNFGGTVFNLVDIGEKTVEPAKEKPQTPEPTKPTKPRPSEPSYSRDEQMSMIKKQFTYEFNGQKEIVVTGLIGEPKEIYIPEIVRSIKSNAFFGKTCLETVTGCSGLLTIGVWAFATAKNLKSITLPHGLWFIGNDAFYGCESLTSLHIPSTVETIGGGITGFCNSLGSLTVDPANTRYRSDAKGSYIYTDYGTVVMGTNRAILPNDGSIKVIGPEAFCQCDKIERFVVPNGVVEIGDNAFADCKDLSVVHIPESLDVIGGNAFSGCKNLLRIMYDGTKKQWKAIKKGSHWDKATGKYKVMFGC